MEKTINFDALKLKEFKKHYNIALNDKKEIFIFEENEYLVSYAKYLIEYLEMSL